MTKSIHICLFLIFFISCSENKNQSIIGKWAAYNDLGYCESIITDSTFETFTEIMGNTNKWNYEIRNDTLEIKHGYKAQIIILNDSTFILKHNNTKETFYRLNDSIKTFNVNLMSSKVKGGDKVFNKFYKKFLKRTLEHKLEKGIIT